MFESFKQRGYLQGKRSWDPERACMDDVNIRRGYSKAAERW